MVLDLSKQHCSLSDPSPKCSATTQPSRLPHPGEYLRRHPSQFNRCTKTQKYGPNERTDQQSEKELSNNVNLSDAEFKTLVIRMLTEMDEYAHKIKEEMKAIQSEIKENL